MDAYLVRYRKSEYTAWCTSVDQDDNAMGWSVRKRDARPFTEEQAHRVAQNEQRRIADMPGKRRVTVIVTGDKKWQQKLSLLSGR